IAGAGNQRCRSWTGPDGVFTRFHSQDVVHQDDLVFRPALALCQLFPEPTVEQADAHTVYPPAKLIDDNFGASWSTAGVYCSRPSAPKGDRAVAIKIHQLLCVEAPSQAGDRVPGDPWEGR